MNVKSAGDGPKAACSRKRPACRSALLFPGGGAPLVCSSTDAVPLLVVSAWLCAVMVTAWLAGMAAGAVYSPSGVIEPAVADQFTAVLDVLATVAMNCAVPASTTLVEGGETDTV